MCISIKASYIKLSSDYEHIIHEYTQQHSGSVEISCMGGGAYIIIIFALWGLQGGAAMDGGE